MRWVWLSLAVLVLAGWLISVHPRPVGFRTAQRLHEWGIFECYQSPPIVAADVRGGTLGLLAGSQEDPALLLFRPGDVWPRWVLFGGSYLVCYDKVFHRIWYAWMAGFGNTKSFYRPPAPR